MISEHTAHQTSIFIDRIENGKTQQAAEGPDMWEQGFFSLFEVATFTVYCKKSIHGDVRMAVQLCRPERCR